MIGIEDDADLAGIKTVRQAVDGLGAAHRLVELCGMKPVREKIDACAKIRRRQNPRDRLADGRLEHPWIARQTNLQRRDRAVFKRLLDQPLLEIGFAAQIGRKNHDLAARRRDQIRLNLIVARRL